MPKRTQYSSIRPTTGCRRQRLSTNASSIRGSYTRKEYLPKEMQRLDELVAQCDNDWIKVVQRYNDEFGGQGRSRTQEGLKNKYGRELKKKREEEKKNGHLTGPGNFLTQGSYEEIIISPYDYHSSPEGQVSCSEPQGGHPTPKQMPSLEYPQGFSFEVVDMMTQIPIPYVEYGLDSVYAGCASGNLGSSPYDLVFTPNALAYTTELGNGLTAYGNLPAMYCGEEDWSWDGLFQYPAC